MGMEMNARGSTATERHWRPIVAWDRRGEQVESDRSGLLIFAQEKRSVAEPPGAFRKRTGPLRDVSAGFRFLNS
jgi:hypothetical protein